MKTFTEEQIRKALIESSLLLEEDREQVADKLGIQLKPRSLTAYGSLHCTPDHELYLNYPNKVPLRDLLNEEWGKWLWGNSQVKVTIEEIL